MFEPLKVYCIVNSWYLEHDISVYPPSCSKDYSRDTLPVFRNISTLVISNYWYLKVNFLGTENLLWDTSSLRWISTLRYEELTVPLHDTWRKWCCNMYTLVFFSWDRRGWLGGVMVLWCQAGHPTIGISVGQGPNALAVGAGGGCLDIFTLIYLFSPLSPSFWETARFDWNTVSKGR